MVSGESRGRHAKPPDPAEIAGSADAAPRGFWGHVSDAVSLRTVLLIVGVLGLQLGFVLSYVGAFHNPQPHQIPMSVVAPAAVAPQAAARLNAISSHPVSAVPVSSEADAIARIRDGTDAAAFVVNPVRTTDTLLVSSAAGLPVSTAVTTVISGADAAQHRSVTVVDVVPLQPGDARGLTGFYLVIGWMIGGYLVAALLGVASGSRPSTLGRACFRLGALVPYAIVSGLGGVLIVDQWLHALTGHFLALWWLGALLVAAAGAATMAFQVLFDLVGIGIAVLLFVILGNPSSGGAYPTWVLPTFWRDIAYALPNGAGTDTVRRIVYFGGNGITGHLVVICAYLAGGVLVTLAASWFLHRRRRAPGRADRTGAAPSPPPRGSADERSPHPASAARDSAAAEGEARLPQSDG